MPKTPPALLFDYDPLIIRPPPSGGKPDGIKEVRAPAPWE
jgi:hypothetical protein